MTRQLWIYLGLAILVLLSWLAADWMAPRSQSVQPAAGHQPDSFSKKFTKITMTEEGKPKNILFAESMVHFKDDDTTELERPVFTYFDKESAPPWVVHSETGFITAEGKAIRLGNQVTITRDAAPGVEPVIINTANLVIQPEIDFAQTDEYAELISNRNYISGVGLSLTFGEYKQINLHSNVKGKYDTH